MNSSAATFHVLDIVKGTTVDGPGFRTSLYLAGCNHHCEGCHNPQSWNPEGGKRMTLGDIMAVVKEEDYDVTLTGGDPLYNPEAVSVLAEAIKSAGHGIWLYTGFRWEQITADEAMREAMKWVDVVVDGKFILARRDTDLQFRGSGNQRIIDVKKSLESGSTVIWTDPFV